MDPLEKKILKLQEMQSEINVNIQKLKDISLKRNRGEDIVDDAICYLYSNPPDDLFSILPELKSNKKFWIEFYRHYYDLFYTPEMQIVFETYASENLRNDRELAIALIKYGCYEYGCYVFAWLPDNLYNDESIIMAMLQARPALLLRLREYLLPTHAALLAAALRRLPRTNTTAAYLEHFSTEPMLNFVGSNLEAAYAWASAGGQYSDEQFSHQIKADHSVMLAFVKNQRDETSIPICEELRQSKDFMIEAIKHNHIYLSLVHDSLHGDEDLALAALTNPDVCFLGEFIDVPEAWCSPISLMARKVRKELKQHNIFVKLILGSVASTKGSNKSPLALLNQGLETKTIAEFLNVPTGERLSLLRKARENLALTGLFWKDCV